MSMSYLEKDNLEKSNKDATHNIIILSAIRENQVTEALFRENEIKSKENPFVAEYDENTDEKQLDEPLALKKIKEKEKDEEEEMELTVVVLIYDGGTGKMLAYSIGSTYCSDNFHDISHLNIDKDDFCNDVNSILDSAKSQQEGIAAVEAKYPGTTYKDSKTADMCNQKSQELYGDDIQAQHTENKTNTEASASAKNDENIQMSALNSNTLTHAHSGLKDYDVGSKVNPEHSEQETNHFTKAITPFNTKPEPY